MVLLYVGGERSKRCLGPRHLSNLGYLREGRYCFVPESVLRICSHVELLVELGLQHVAA